VVVEITTGGTGDMMDDINLETKLELLKRSKLGRLNPIKEARIFKSLIEDHGYTQQKIADEIIEGGQQYVSSRLILLRLHPEVQEKVTTNVVSPSAGEIISVLESKDRQKYLSKRVERGNISEKDLQGEASLQTEVNRLVKKLEKKEDKKRFLEEIEKEWGTCAGHRANFLKRKFGEMVKDYSGEEKEEVLIDVSSLDGEGLILNNQIEKTDVIPEELLPFWNSVWGFWDVNWSTEPYTVFRAVSGFKASYIPFLVEQLLYRYTHIGDKVLDPCMGSGTTLITSKLMKRNSVGIDCSEKYVKLVKDRLNFKPKKYQPVVYQGNAMDMVREVADSYDFICFSPVYWDIVNYETEKENEEIQIANAKTEDEYLEMMKKVLSECYRVLKPGKYCACVVSDVRKKKLIPIGWKIGLLGEEIGFKLWDVVIHHTTNSRSKAGHRGLLTRNAVKNDYSVRTHEYVIIWKKPENAGQKKLEEHIGHPKISSQDLEAFM